MNHHIARWHSLTFSPADRAILDQMEEEHETEPTVAALRPSDMAEPTHERSEDGDDPGKP